ncbi:DUF975 family protein [Mediterraneibacter glycyrrhizinilyticus]|uniref:DUF975 family protein n=1 Tax=Mediterraneibacter glycyrrhizinilyticus TaxID=342942 RepID=UPI0025AA4D21|nr:DUF975 family protein [Mediterraneibacter glycyrrhizinilyticus]MDN0059894.1 DUF975 family protein [Mediterraneibacter glycyrrhizinilyticus]
MWKRKVIKKKAMALMKQGYFRILPVCFLIAMLTTAYSFSTTFLNLQISSGSLGNDAAYVSGIPNSEAILDIAVHLLEGTALSGILNGILYDFLSMIIDLFSTNISVFFSFIRTANYFLTDGFSSVLIFSAISILFALVYQIFVSNILLIGEKRFFMENRNYPQTAISKIFFLYKLRYLRHPAWIMFSRTLFQSVWNLTIVGGIIKHYEYILIPYILAENPKISRKDAFFLSKQLMRRNKRKFFLLDLSFLGWHILSLFTLGLLDLLFVNPYITSCRTELYATLRRNYVLSRSAKYEELNDSYLEHVPSDDELLIIKALYDDSQGPYTKISYFAPEQYPVFLFSVQPPLKAVRSPFRADRRYDLLSYLFLFPAFSIFGWVLEAVINLINRGVIQSHTPLYGPWILLYGIYGILILFLLKRLIRKPVAVFLINALLYSLLEYFINLGTELASGEGLRNYSEFLLNLDGKVYLGGTIAFALIGCAFLYYLAPRWADRYMKLGHSKRILLCTVLYILLIADIVFSVCISS